MGWVAPTLTKQLGVIRTASLSIKGGPNNACGGGRTTLGAL